MGLIREYNFMLDENTQKYQYDQMQYNYFVPKLRCAK